MGRKNGRESVGIDSLCYGESPAAVEQRRSLWWGEKVWDPEIWSCLSLVLEMKKAS